MPVVISNQWVWFHNGHSFIMGTVLIYVVHHYLLTWYDLADKLSWVYRTPHTSTVTCYHDRYDREESILTL